MKKPSPHSATGGIDVDDQAVRVLLERIRKLVQTARTTAVTAINSVQVVSNFEIGRMIVEHEQAGARRAEYGKEVLKTLSERLMHEFGQGFSKRNLEYMRRFYLLYRERRPRIAQTLFAQLPIPVESQKAEDTTQTPSAQFSLGWSHYVFLMGIDNGEERSFYEIEALSQNWSLRELKRQFNSGFYERLALSRDKKRLRELSEKGQIVATPQDVIKDPYVLEFLGLQTKAGYSEHDLETAIIDRLEHFLLELGKGFLFEARQKRFTFDSDNFYVDLVFYNRLLRCYVLIDLKIGKLAHQDLGQMQMYVNYFDRYICQKDENPSVGIVLCKMKHDAMVELTLPKNANIYASQYQLYLPSKEDLRKRLMEWAEEKSHQ
jgi:predicted nuclease of restriction endonuclease-like (RecB) superfamily